ncbi:hypothetical protein MMC30_003087 [Trapelia coarctata]|nr:hypothetical protein [Trapelia coarctata]
MHADLPSEGSTQRRDQPDPQRTGAPPGAIYQNPHLDVPAHLVATAVASQIVFPRLPVVLDVGASSDATFAIIAAIVVLDERKQTERHQEGYHYEQMYTLTGCGGKERCQEAYKVDERLLRGCGGKERCQEAYKVGERLLRGCGGKERCQKAYKVDERLLRGCGGKERCQKAYKVDERLLRGCGGKERCQKACKVDERLLRGCGGKERCQEAYKVGERLLRG